MSFPVYRKYPNNKTFFKIYSFEEFEELKIIGNNYSIHQYQSKIFTDRILIQDMIETTGQHWVIATEEEYEKTINYCKSSLRKI